MLLINKFFFIIRKIIVAALFIYAYDVFGISLGVNIPINFCTVFMVSVFGMVAMTGLILFSFSF